MGKRLLLTGVVAILAFLFFTRVLPPPAPWHFQNHSCGKCHGNRKLSNHTVEFQQSSHGPLALRAEARCLSCHRQESCENCHQDPDHQPAWHDEAVRNPKQTSTSWRRHAEQARMRRSSCATCHLSQQQKHCMSCHRAGAPLVSP